MTSIVIGTEAVLNIEEFEMSNSTSAQLQRGVIVEFDFAVLSGHQSILDIYSARLSKEDVKLDATLMARFMGGKSFSSGLNALCNKQQKTIDVPAVIAECNEQFSEAVKGALAQVPSGFTAFVGALLAKGMKVVLVTRGDVDAVREAFASVATDKLVALHDASGGFGFLSWDGWRRAARKSDLHERLCVGVAGSGFSVKGALNSGLGVMVKVNPLTEHQDISGCDGNFGEYTAGLADDVIRILHV
jgi:hypothetical protein